MYFVQLYMHSLSSVKIAYHGDDGGDERHCAHVVMFNLFEYVLYCFKCDSVDDDDKMVIWCTIAQIWCTIAPGFMGDGSKPPPECIGPKIAAQPESRLHKSRLHKTLVHKSRSKSFS